jgi:hypothetical protein
MKGRAQYNITMRTNEVVAMGNDL